MTIYQQVFGGSNISPSEVSYRLINLTSNLRLEWPLESVPNAQTTARIMDVNATLPATAGVFWSITLPDTRSVGIGETLLINNIGANLFTVLDNAGNTIVSPSPGNVWQLYLVDNSTAKGTWKTILYGAQSSAANASALAGFGLSAFGNQLITAMAVTNLVSNYTPQSIDRAKVYNWTAANGIITLPPAGSLTNSWYVVLRNSGTGAIAITPTPPNTINGGTTLTLQPNNSAIVVCDGLNFYTIGLGQQAIFAFDFTAIDLSLAEPGQYVLSGAALNRVAYNFFGLLPGNIDIIVPNTVQQYWVANSTTGPYTLTIGTASQINRIILLQASRFITYCDGNNVVKADNQGFSFPLTIAQGGTGATTAATALINLGGTSTGTALFTIASTAAARLYIGAASSDDVIAAAIALG